MTDKCVACGEVAEGKPLYKKLGSSDCQVEVFTALHEMQLLSLAPEEKNNHYICWDCDETIAEEYATFISTEAKKKAVEAKRKQQDEARKIKLQKKLKQAFKKAHDDKLRASGFTPPVSKYKMREKEREENRYHASYCLMCKCSFEATKARGYQRFPLQKMVDDEYDVADVLQRLGQNMEITAEMKRKRFVCCQCYNKVRRNFKALSKGSSDNSLPIPVQLQQSNDQMSVFSRRPTTEEHAAEISKLIPPNLASVYKVVTEEEEGSKTTQMNQKYLHLRVTSKRERKYKIETQRNYSTSGSFHHHHNSLGNESSSFSPSSSSPSGLNHVEVSDSNPANRVDARFETTEIVKKKRGRKRKNLPIENNDHSVNSTKTPTIRTFLPKGANEHGSYDNDVSAPIALTSGDMDVVDFGICNLCGLGYNARPKEFWFTLNHCMPSVMGVTVMNALQILESDLADVSSSVREKELVCKPCFSRVCKGFRSQILRRIAEKKGIDVNALELSKIKVKMMNASADTDQTESEKNEDVKKVNGAINNNNNDNEEKTKKERIITLSSSYKTLPTKCHNSSEKIIRIDSNKTVAPALNDLKEYGVSYSIVDDRDRDQEKRDSVKKVLEENHLKKRKIGPACTKKIALNEELNAKSVQNSSHNEENVLKFRKCSKSFRRTLAAIQNDLELINLINDSKHLRYKGKVVLLNSVTVDIADLNGILPRSVYSKNEAVRLELYKELHQFTNFRRNLKNKKNWDRCILCQKEGLGIDKTTRWLEDPVAPPNLMVPLRWAQLSIATDIPDSKINLATDDGKVCEDCHHTLRNKFSKFVSTRVATSHGLSSEKVVLDKYKVSFDSKAMNIIADPLEPTKSKESRKKQRKKSNEDKNNNEDNANSEKRCLKSAEEKKLIDKHGSCEVNKELAAINGKHEVKTLLRPITSSEESKREFGNGKTNIKLNTTDDSGSKGTDVEQSERNFKVNPIEIHNSLQSGSEMKDSTPRKIDQEQHNTSTNELNSADHIVSSLENNVTEKLFNNPGEYISELFSPRDKSVDIVNGNIMEEREHDIVSLDLNLSDSSDSEAEENDKQCKDPVVTCLENTNIKLKSSQIEHQNTSVKDVSEKFNHINTEEKTTENPISSEDKLHADEKENIIKENASKLLDKSECNNLDNGKDNSESEDQTLLIQNIDINNDKEKTDVPIETAIQIDLSKVMNLNVNSTINSQENKTKEPIETVPDNVMNSRESEDCSSESSESDEEKEIVQDKNECSLKEDVTLSSCEMEKPLKDVDPSSIQDTQELMTNTAKSDVHTVQETSDKIMLGSKKRKTSDTSFTNENVSKKKCLETNKAHSEMVNQADNKKTCFEPYEAHSEIGSQADSLKTCFEPDVIHSEIENQANSKKILDIAHSEIENQANSKKILDKAHSEIENQANSKKISDVAHTKIANQDNSKKILNVGHSEIANQANSKKSDVAHSEIENHADNKETCLEPNEAHSGIENQADSDMEHSDSEVEMIKSKNQIENDLSEYLGYEKNEARINKISNGEDSLIPNAEDYLSKKLCDEETSFKGDSLKQSQKNAEINNAVDIPIKQIQNKIGEDSKSLFNKRKSVDDDCNVHLNPSLSELSDNFMSSFNEEVNEYGEDNVAPFAQRKKFKSKHQGQDFQISETEALQSCLEDIWNTIQGISLDDLICEGIEVPLKLQQYNIGVLLALNDLRVHLGASLEDLIVWVKRLLPIDLREKGMKPSMEKFSMYLLSINNSTEEINSKLLKQVLPEELFHCPKLYNTSAEQERIVRKCYLEDVMDKSDKKKSLKWEDFLAPVNLDHLLAGKPSRVSWNEFNNGLLYALWKVNNLMHGDEENFIKWLSLTSTTVMKNKDYVAMSKAVVAIDKHLQNYPEEINRLVAPIVVRSRAVKNNEANSEPSSSIANNNSSQNKVNDKESTGDEDIILEKEILLSQSRKKNSKNNSYPSSVDMSQTMDLGKKYPHPKKMARVLPQPPTDGSQEKPTKLSEFHSGNSYSDSAFGNNIAMSEDGSVKAKNSRSNNCLSASSQCYSSDNVYINNKGEQTIHSNSVVSSNKYINAISINNQCNNRINTNTNVNNPPQMLVSLNAHSKAELLQNQNGNNSFPPRSESVILRNAVDSNLQYQNNFQSSVPVVAIRSSFSPASNTISTGVPLIPVLNSGGYMTMIPLSMKAPTSGSPSHQYNSLPGSVKNPSAQHLVSLNPMMVSPQIGSPEITSSTVNSGDGELASKVDNLERQLQEIQKQNSQLLEMNQKLLEKRLKETEKERPSTPVDSTNIASSSGNQRMDHNPENSHFQGSSLFRSQTKETASMFRKIEPKLDTENKNSKRSFEDALNYKYKK